MSKRLIERTSEWTFWGGLLGSVCIVALSGRDGSWESMSLWIYAIILVAMTGAVSVGFDIRHPLVWFNCLFATYAIAGPILLLLEILPGNPQYFEEALILEYIAIIVVSMAISHTRVSYSSLHCNDACQLRRGGLTLIIIAIGLVLPYLMSFAVLGSATKVERHTTEKLFIGTDFAYGMLIVGFSAYYAASIRLRRAIPKMMVITVVAFCVVSFLIGGERYILVRLALVYLFLHVTFWRPMRAYKIVVIAIALVILSTAAGLFKNIMLTGELSRLWLFDELSDPTLITTTATLFLGSELRTPSSNLAMLIEHIPDKEEFWYGRSTLLELGSLWKIGFLYDRDPERSTADWFANTFYPEYYAEGGGMGFTLVGQGYIDYGLLGVVLLFVMVGLAFRVLYFMSSKGLVSYLMYINIIPICMYGIRQTTGAILSQSVKQAAAGICVVLALGLIMRIDKQSGKRCNSKTVADGMRA